MESWGPVGTGAPATAGCGVWGDGCARTPIHDHVPAVPRPVHFHGWCTWRSLSKWRPVGFHTIMYDSIQLMSTPIHPTYVHPSERCIDQTHPPSPNRTPLEKTDEDGDGQRRKTEDRRRKTEDGRRRKKTEEDGSRRKTERDGEDGRRT